MMTKGLKKKMDLHQVKSLLEAEVLCCNDCLDKEIEMVAASDLMSDVLAFVKTDSLLLNGLINPQVVRTAEMAEIAAICFVRGKRPQEETIKLANEKKHVIVEQARVATMGRLSELKIVDWKVDSSGISHYSLNKEKADLLGF